MEMASVLVAEQGNTDCLLHFLHRALTLAVFAGLLFTGACAATLRKSTPPLPAAATQHLWRAIMAQRILPILQACSVMISSCVSMPVGIHRGLLRLLMLRYLLMLRDLDLTA